jgi:hypothetical protein
MKKPHLPLWIYWQLWVDSPYCLILILMRLHIMEVDGDRVTAHRHAGAPVVEGIRDFSVFHESSLICPRHRLRLPLETARH